MQATQTIDPACPRTTESATVTAVRALSWAVLVVSVAGGLYVLIAFRRTDIITGVGSPLPVPTFETVTNWPAIGLGLGLCLQGLIVWAVLQALASIAQDVTGIRISARAAAMRAPLLLLALTLAACGDSSTSPSYCNREDTGEPCRPAGTFVEPVSGGGWRVMSHTTVVGRVGYEDRGVQCTRRNTRCVREECAISGDGLTQSQAVAICEERYGR